LLRGHVLQELVSTDNIPLRSVLLYNGQMR
jgi:hypothetical protein